MEFEEYLKYKHSLKKGERKLKEISIEQYINRLENMRREGIYKEEIQIDIFLEQKVIQRYKDWRTYMKQLNIILILKTININS